MATNSSSPSPPPLAAAGGPDTAVAPPRDLSGAAVAPAVDVAVAGAPAAAPTDSTILRRVRFDDDTPRLDERPQRSPYPTSGGGLDRLVPRQSSSPMPHPMRPATAPRLAQGTAPHPIASALPVAIGAAGGLSSTSPAATAAAIGGTLDDDAGSVGSYSSVSDEEDVAVGKALLADWEAEEADVDESESEGEEEVAATDDDGAPGAPADDPAPRGPTLRDPPPLVPLDDIPPRRREIIQAAAKDIYGIETMRDFQIVGVHHVAYNRDTYLVVNRATADGKSLIPKVLNVLKGGVGIYIVPLLGLGSDQVDKAVVVEHNVEALHVDEHKREHAHALKRRLLSLSDEELRHVVVQLYFGPRAFTSDLWRPVLQQLAARGHIAFFCVDEGHEVEQSGRFFRTEFRTAAKLIPALIKLMPRPVPRIVMSATLTKKDQDTVTALLGEMKPNVLSGPLSRRDVKFTVHITGDAAASLKRSADHDLHDSKDHQQLWYTNSRTNAEGSLLDAAVKLLESHKRDAIADSFTGSDGIMKKTTTMDAISQYELLRGEGTVLDRTSWLEAGDDLLVGLPRIQILVATKSAQAGIDGMWIKFSKKKGLPSSMYELVQEMGRVNRSRQAPAGSNTYEVHISFESYVSTYVRIMRCDDASERATQLKHLHQVLKLIVAPTQCYHTSIEEYFEREPVSRGPCGQYCSYCLEEVELFTKRVYRNGLISFLTTKVFGSSVPPTPKSFKDAMKADKANIFHPRDVPRQKAGPIHALALQLLANDVIGFCVTDSTKRGTDKFSDSHIGVELLKKRDESSADQMGPWLPSYMVESSWVGLNLVDSVVTT